uniref:Secreted protein n=1 Tax=Steinernema glaseri TaxID=37863 RepID=A0A1I7Z273_9BILA
MKTATIVLLVALFGFSNAFFFPQQGCGCAMTVYFYGHGNHAFFILSTFFQRPMLFGHFIRRRLDSPISSVNVGPPAAIAVQNKLLLSARNHHYTVLICNWRPRVAGNPSRSTTQPADPFAAGNLFSVSAGDCGCEEGDDDFAVLPPQLINLHPRLKRDALGGTVTAFRLCLRRVQMLPLGAEGRRQFVLSRSVMAL